MKKQVILNALVMGIMGAVYGASLEYFLVLINPEPISAKALRVFIHDSVLGGICTALSCTFANRLWAQFTIFLVSCSLLSASESVLSFRAVNLGIDQGLAFKLFVDQVRWVVVGLVLVGFTLSNLSKYGLGFRRESGGSSPESSGLR